VSAAGFFLKQSWHTFGYAPCFVSTQAAKRVTVVTPKFATRQTAPHPSPHPTFYRRGAAPGSPFTDCAPPPSDITPSRPPRPPVFWGGTLRATPWAAGRGFRGSPISDHPSPPRTGFFPRSNNKLKNACVA
jgi:hypothetical protein